MNNEDIIQKLAEHDTLIATLNRITDGLVKETVSLKAENVKLKQALREIRSHEERCRRKGVGFDAYIFAVANKVLEDGEPADQKLVF